MSGNSRVALVTGGGRGIGQAISKRLAADGHTIAVNYHSDEEAAMGTVDEIVQAGGKAHAFRANVEVFEENERMVDDIVAFFGPIGILVNNAGIASRGLSVADTDPKELARVVAVHAFGAHYLSKLVVPAMRQMERADIVMISSVATKTLAANGAPYNMAKSCVEALAATLSKEELTHGIRVNTVAPGLVETEMGRRLVRATAGILDMRELDPISPFGHVIQPEDVANIVSFIVSNVNTYITGERIACDGGAVSPS